jgi:hypothetical protein
MFMDKRRQIVGENNENARANLTAHRKALNTIDEQTGNYARPEREADTIKEAARRRELEEREQQIKDDTLLSAEQKEDALENVRKKLKALNDRLARHHGLGRYHGVGSWRDLGGTHEEPGDPPEEPGEPGEPPEEPGEPPGEPGEVPRELERMEIPELDFNNYAELYARRKNLFSGRGAQERLDAEGIVVAEQISRNVEAIVNNFMIDNPDATAEQIRAAASQAYIDAQNTLQQQIIDHIDGEGMGFRGVLRKFGKMMDYSSMRWRDIRELEGAEKAKAIAMKLGKWGLLGAGIAGLGVIGIGAATGAISLSFALGSGTAIGAAKGGGIGFAMARHGSRNSAVRNIDLENDAQFQEILNNLDLTDRRLFDNISDWLMEQRNNASGNTDHNTNRRKSAIATGLGAIMGGIVGSVQVNTSQPTGEVNSDPRYGYETTTKTVEDPGHWETPTGQPYNVHHVEGVSNVEGWQHSNGQMFLHGDLSPFGNDAIGQQVGGAFNPATGQFYPFPGNIPPAGYTGPLAWVVNDTILASEGYHNVFDISQLSSWIDGGSHDVLVRNLIRLPNRETEIFAMSLNAARTAWAHVAGYVVTAVATKFAADLARARRNRGDNQPNNPAPGARPPAPDSAPVDPNNQSLPGESVIWNINNPNLNLMLEQLAEIQDEDRRAEVLNDAESSLNGLSEEVARGLDDETLNRTMTVISRWGDLSNNENAVPNYPESYANFENARRACLARLNAELERRTAQAAQTATSAATTPA